MSMVEQQDLFLKDVVKLLAFAWEKNFVVTGGELFRTIDQQGLYYARGKTTTMNSKHLQRLAIDLNFFVGNSLVRERETLQEVGNYWESLSDRNRWGGNWTGFPDLGHFQRSP